MRWRRLLRPGPLLLLSVVAGGPIIFRAIKRRLTPADPNLALRYGMHLTRKAQRTLAVTAHQDDLELFLAGTLRLLSLAGSQITVAVATGGGEQYAGEPSLAEIRDQEERDAGTILGYDTVRFLPFGDLGLSHNPHFEEEIRTIWQDVRPEVVFAFDPTAPYRSATHPDHLTVGRVVLNIARSLGSAAPDVVFYGSRDPNVLVDISNVIEDKTEAIRAHSSQLTGWKRFYNPVMHLQARIAGLAVSVRYAEPLRYLDLPTLEKAAYLENWTQQEPQRT